MGLCTKCFALGKENKNPLAWDYCDSCHTNDLGWSKDNPYPLE